MCAPPVFLCRSSPTLRAEFIPASHQYLLTVLSIWWAFGQLLGSLVRALRPPSPRANLHPQIAWPLIVHFSCAGTTPATCPRSENQGWRYFMYAMGGLMLALSFLRFGVFRLHESPKYLMGRGRDAEAVAVVHRVAAYNGVRSSLTLQMLRDVERPAGEPVRMDTSARGAVVRKLRVLSGEHVRSLFATKKLAWSTSLMILCWGASESFRIVAPADLVTSSRPDWPRIPSVSSIDALRGVLTHLRFITAIMASSHTCKYSLWLFFSRTSQAFTFTNSFETRGEEFGDGSVNITYRNVRPLSYPPSCD